MKKILAGLVCVLLVATAALAIEYNYGTITLYSVTKGNITIPIKQETKGDRFAYKLSTDNCTLYINNTGNTGMPVVKDTLVEIRTQAGVGTNMIFSCTSTAAASPNKAYIVR